MKRNNLSLQGLRTFIAVVDCSGVARAAKVLGYTQPALTLQLRQLERRLDVALFERHSRQLFLTAAGRQILGTARQLLKDVETLENSAKLQSSEPVTPLVIGALESVATNKLSPILAQFRDRLPHVNVRLEILGGDTIAKAAAARTIDVAITVPTSLQGWIYEPLFVEPLVALMRADHPLANQKSVSLSRLGAGQILLTDESCVYRRATERAMARHGMRANAAIQSSSLMSLPNAVAARLGIAIVPKEPPD